MNEKQLAEGIRNALINFNNQITEELDNKVGSIALEDMVFYMTMLAMSQLALEHPEELVTRTLDNMNELLTFINGDDDEKNTEPSNPRSEEAKSNPRGRG